MYTIAPARGEERRGAAVLGHATRVIIDLLMLATNLIREPAMKPQLATVETHGFYGAYYPAPRPTTRAIIVMLGDSSTDRMAQSGAW